MDQIIDFSTHKRSYCLSTDLASTGTLLSLTAYVCTTWVHRNSWAPYFPRWEITLSQHLALHTRTRDPELKWFARPITKWCLYILISTAYFLFVLALGLWKLQSTSYKNVSSVFMKLIICIYSPMIAFFFFKPRGLKKELQDPTRNQQPRI